MVPSRNLGDEPNAGDPSGVIVPTLEGLPVRYGEAGDNTGDLVPVMLDGDLGGDLGGSCDDTSD